MLFKELRKDKKEQKKQQTKDNALHAPRERSKNISEARIDGRAQTKAGIRGPKIIKSTFLGPLTGGVRNFLAPSLATTVSTLTAFHQYLFSPPKRHHFINLLRLEILYPMPSL